MHKILPLKIFLIVFITAVVLFSSIFPPKVNAQSASEAAEGQWVPDAEVTFVGKTASRSAQFLDWTLQNYSWLCVKKEAQNQCDNTGNPLVSFWMIIRNIVYALLALFVLATAFILIISRGQNITIMRFIPRFVLIIVIITLSFSLIQFIYQAGDVVQDFFLKYNREDPVTHVKTPIYISTQDLLYMGFNYQDFKGYRVTGDQYTESAFISLLLVRLTAITYYVMTGILIVRKIILWFFIIVSPIFPLLLFYRPIRNTAKLWIGEFFRWLLYAPLFAVFLQGLVVVWQKGIPLPFAISDPAGPVVYPTAVNILLGGPGERIFYNSVTSANSVNLSDTFAKYVVALLMLWVVILLPFLLLKIFLDWISTLSFENNMAIKQLMNRNIPFLNPPGGTPPPKPSTPPTMPQAAGAARSLPFFASRGATTIPIQIKADVQASVKESSDVLRSANLSIPKMRDIAAYEVSSMSRDSSVRSKASEMHSTLTKIANPNTAIVTSDREKFTTVRQKLLDQQQKGNPIASGVLAASQASINAKAQGTVATKQQQLSHAAQSQPAALPSVNRVQQVSLEDYEEVRNLWNENYQNIEPPRDLSGQQMDRRQWIKNDVDRINQAIALLSSQSPDEVNKGMSMVANILPFLLIGGFSKSEVVAYLKAKMEAGKGVLSQIQKKEDEEESTVSTQKKEEAKPKEMSASAAESFMDKTEDMAKPAESVPDKKNDSGNKPL